MFKFAVTIPSMIGESLDPTAQTAQIEKAMRLFSKLFGGATAHAAIGAWVDSAGQLVRENVMVVESYTNNDDHAPTVRHFAAQLQLEMSQECVAVVIEKVDGGMEFIDERKDAA